MIIIIKAICIYYTQDVAHFWCLSQGQRMKVITMKLRDRMNQKIHKAWPKAMLHSHKPYMGIFFIFQALTYFSSAEIKKAPPLWNLKRSTQKVCLKICVIHVNLFLPFHLFFWIKYPSSSWNFFMITNHMHTCCTFSGL